MLPTAYSRIRSQPMIQAMILKLLYGLSHVSIRLPLWLVTDGAGRRPPILWPRKSSEALRS